MEEQRSRKPMVAAALGAILGVIVLLIGAFLGGTLFGYELGMENNPPAGSSDANLPPRDQKQLYAGEWWGDAEGKISGSVKLSLIENGKLSGNDGCNSGSGSWSVSGSRISFRDLVSTEIYCEHVDTYLFDASSAKLSDDGSDLELFAEDGRALGTLHRTVSIDGLNR